MTAKEKDRLTEMIKAAGAARMAEELTAKTEQVHIRVSPADKREIREMADACGLTVGEYLFRLHKLAQEGLVKLATASKAAPRSAGTKRGRG